MSSGSKRIVVGLGEAEYRAWSFDAAKRQNILESACEDAKQAGCSGLDIRSPRGELLIELKVGPLKIYVASSWRNTHQAEVVKRLREDGHDVYDFRNPKPGDHGFSWEEIDVGWLSWTPERFAEALKHPIAQEGFKSDMDALSACDACVLVLPCGRSAHLEAGWAIGAGKPTIIYAWKLPEPELMYLMAGRSPLVHSIEDVQMWLSRRFGCGRGWSLLSPMKE